jgi:hypothetical protein
VVIFNERPVVVYLRIAYQLCVAVDGTHPDVGFRKGFQPFRSRTFLQPLAGLCKYLVALCPGIDLFVELKKRRFPNDFAQLSKRGERNDYVVSKTPYGARM